MKKYQNEDEVNENTDLSSNFKMYASDRDDDKDDDREEEEEDDLDGGGDWGDVDPAGGPAPTSPGSAV
ncbi:hypothetical protein [uncultured Flavobacterium sp.]|uniref:hypothetical protein n=1 Tax=uncultured Flavobacterium sp. TaxID=165435 RepID=UPI0025EC225A|nr:hypothetical protein [uncultured Flavobacterium sp.]